MGSVKLTVLGGGRSLSYVSHPSFTMKIIQRQTAIQEGLLFYFTGKLCKYGHLDLRRVDDKVCKSCNAMKAKQHYHKYIDSSRRKALNWAKSNPEKDSAKSARRRAKLLQALPSWANVSDIDKIYALAAEISQESNKPFEVDHIVPLSGKTVCGLHIASNLQIVERLENRRKSNSF